jgi:hypothetical protein
MRVTNFQRIQESLDKQEMCKCDRGQKVMYYCALATCPNNKLWPLYCILCNDDEPPKHEHRAKTIAIKGESVKDEWHKLRAKINESLNKTKNWFGLHGDLVKILSDPEYHGNDQMLKD